MAEGKDSSRSTDKTKTSSGRAGCARSALISLAVILVIIYIFVEASGGNDDNDDDVERRERQNEAAEDPGVTTTVVDRTDAVTPICPDEDGSSERTLQFTEAPPMCLDPDTTYVATVETNRGDFEITLDPTSAPQAVNSFVFLARYHFYDGVGFHRVLRDLLAQAGDPFDPDVGEGGNAGYLLPEEVPTEPPYYPKGAVALANSNTPNSTGAEFMVFTGAGAEQAGGGPTFSRIGEVTSGIEVVDAINATSSSNDTIGVPTERTTIETITIDED